MIKVQSSNLHAVGTQGKDGPGSTYRYRGAAHHHDPLIRATSPGSYFHQHVKTMSGEKVEEGNARSS